MTDTGRSPALQGRSAAADAVEPVPVSSKADIPNAKWRVLDMFAGIGGFSLGLHRTGYFETVALCEVEPYACRVLEKNFPGVPNIGDVTKAEFPEVDFITAGFPCQDISNAGQRAGITGSRSGLYGHVVRAIRLVRPKGALLENVAALLGRGMDVVLGDLAEIGNDAEWNCIPASAAGAPHIRDRVWIYAYPQHPDANGPGSHRAEQHDGSSEPRNEQSRLSGPLGQILAKAKRQQDQQRRERELLGRRTGAAAVSRRKAAIRYAGPSSWWAVEPDVGRVAHGVPSRVDRLRCLGNAVVPQIPEMIGRAIVQAIESAETDERRAA